MTDCSTMMSIVEDPEVGANFAVLVILRIDRDGAMRGSAAVFLPQRGMAAGHLLFEEKTS